jgi:hypothetical protein
MCISSLSHAAEVLEFYTGYTLSRPAISNKLLLFAEKRDVGPVSAG